MPNAASPVISAGANGTAVHTMLGHTRFGICVRQRAARRRAFGQRMSAETGQCSERQRASVEAELVLLAAGDRVRVRHQLRVRQAYANSPKREDG